MVGPDTPARTHVVGQAETLAALAAAALSRRGGTPLDPGTPQPFGAQSS